MNKKTKYELMCEYVGNGESLRIGGSVFYREPFMEYEYVFIECDGTVHQYKFFDDAWEDFYQYNAEWIADDAVCNGPTSVVEMFDVHKDGKVLASFADREEANEYARSKMELCHAVDVISSATGEVFDTFYKYEIETLDLSVRSFNCLVRAGIETIDQLRNISFEDLHHIRNLGRRSIAEVMLKLLELDGLSYDGIKSRLDFVFNKENV